jgi:hypothetical protein
MTLKSLIKQGTKMMQDPRVLKALQDPRVMKAVSKGFELKGKVQQHFDQSVEQLANNLNLATKAEVRDLKRTIRKLERDLKKAGGSSDAA